MNMRDDVLMVTQSIRKMDHPQQRSVRLILRILKFY